MSIDEARLVTPIEEAMRDSVVAYIKEVALLPTPHYLSLVLIQEGLESEQIDPATAFAHLELMDISDLS